ncbi:BLUF domain-containing protein [Pseudidiomarina taiwanensis]|uniref:BLUF domain-containing protein n=1 Tax=Pseudidiomarina taiwanensis TaxID=337250 RepID=A0A432ZEJ7_9GAMM|nr:hypothetical protein CWI83_08135 [Pseudidiomarina taiwanensis]
MVTGCGCWLNGRSATPKRHSNGEAFFQVLEGGSEVIYPLYEKIKQDARHRDIVMIMDTVIHRRGTGCRTLV